jgi:hypothetical protein
MSVIDTDALKLVWDREHARALTKYDKSPTKENHGALIRISEKRISLARLMCHI